MHFLAVGGVGPAWLSYEFDCDCVLAAGVHTHIGLKDFVWHEREMDACTGVLEVRAPGVSCSCLCKDACISLVPLVSLPVNNKHMFVLYTCCSMCVCMMYANGLVFPLYHAHTARCE